MLQLDQTKSRTRATHRQSCAPEIQRPRAVQTAAAVGPRPDNVDKHTHIWPVNMTKGALCQTMVRRQIVYTNGGRKKVPSKDPMGGWHWSGATCGHGV